MGTTRRMRTRRPDVPSRRGRRWVAAVIGLGMIALVVATMVRLLTVASALRDAEGEIESATDEIKEGRIADAVLSLRAAQRAIDSANGHLRTSPELSVLGAVPGIRQNLEAVEDSVQLAASVIHGGQRILDAARDLEGEDGTLQVSLSAGTVDVEDIARAHVEISTLRSQLPDRVPGTSSLLLPNTRELFERVHEEAVRRQAELDRLDDGLRLLTELVGAERPRRFLLAVANTAEMRGTGGMILNYGVLEGEGGKVELTDFGRVEELDVRIPLDPEAVGLPQDYIARWSGLDVTREWRNATMSADVPLVAPVLEAMFRRATGLPVDGVIQVDPAGLARILEAVGSIELRELGVVDATNVEALVLNEAYIRYPRVEERADVLGDVAEAVFRRLVDGRYPSVRDLAVVIAEAVDGRHVVAHSRTAEVQRVISRFGASGALPEPETLDYLHLTAQNMSGNKLDYYLDTEIEVMGRRPTGDVGSWKVDITLSNTAPAGRTQPRYIFGPYDESHAVGTYRAAVTLYLPFGSSLDSSSDGPYRLAPSLHTEHGRPLVGFWIDVPAGESRTVSLDLRLAPRPPTGDYELLLVPSPRVRPTTASVRVETDGGAAVARVTLDRPWVATDTGPARATPGG